MKRKNSKSKKQLTQEIKQMRKKLMMGGKSLETASLKDLKGEASMLEYLMNVEFGSGESIAKKLINNGVELPDPEQIPDEQISEKLWEVINGMADLYHFIDKTDHLSDRELYKYLWCTLLNETTSNMGPGCGSLAAQHDLISTDSLDFFIYYASEEDMDFYDTYYDGEPPLQKKLPFNRDEKLPSLESRVKLS